MNESPFLRFPLRRSLLSLLAVDHISPEPGKDNLIDELPLREPG